MNGTELFEGGGCEFVFLVEVGGDDEETVFVEAFESLIEDLGPDRFVVPIILVTEEGDVGGSDFGKVEEAVATMGDEVGRGVFGDICEFLFPTRVCLADFGGADVEALKVGGF